MFQLQRVQSMSNAITSLVTCINNRFAVTNSVISSNIIVSGLDVQLEQSEKDNPAQRLSLTGRQQYKATLHRIWFGTCGFVPMSYFYSETNERSKQWALLCSITTSRQYHRKFHFTWQKSDSSLLKIYKSIKTFFGVNWVRLVARFPQSL